MFKADRMIGLMIFLTILFALSGCSQVNQGESPAKKEASQGSDAHGEMQKEEDPGGGFSFYPSGSDFVKTIIDKGGSLEIDDGLRESFNIYARDFRWEYVPEMNYYESFFDADEYAESFGYNNFGYAAFYVMGYMDFPQKISAEDMQKAIRSLFVAKESYEEMPHQAYRHLVNYQDGYYSPWPAGSVDFYRYFYLLTGLEVLEEDDGLYITTRARSYYFNDPEIYEMGENERWLAQKAEMLGIDELEAAARLVANGQIDELNSSEEIETMVYISNDELESDHYNPKFVYKKTLKNQAYKN